MKKIFQYTTMIIALLCFAATIVLMMATVQFNNIKCQIAGVITFILMWLFSTLNNICYGKEE